MIQQADFSEIAAHTLAISRNDVPATIGVAAGPFSSAAVPRTATKSPRFVVDSTKNEHYRMVAAVYHFIKTTIIHSKTAVASRIIIN